MLLEDPGILLLYRGSMSRKRHRAREIRCRLETRERCAGHLKAGMLVATWEAYALLVWMKVG